ncbi:MAG: HpcH/HpaI aldolase/citrate lyase family protein [Myxococcota bacterium]
MFYLEKLGRLVIPRTELTYPCHKIEMHKKAARAPVDHVMADFEDACPYEFKGEPSRKVMVEALNTIDFGDRVVVIRPNNIKSKYFLGDLDAIMTGAVDRFHGIILPKTNEPEDIVHLSRLLDGYEKQAGWTTTVRIEALIETPIAIVNAYAIARASERMAGLIFGIADFASAMGVKENVRNQNHNFHYAKQATVVAAKACGLHAIDNAWLKLWRGDMPEDRIAEIQREMREKNESSRDLGMDGTWVIHPQQAEIANEVFSPTAEDIEEAKHAIVYYHEQGGGAVYDPKYGKFHDEATIKGVLMELAKGVQAGKVDNAFLNEMARKSEEVTGYNILELMKRVA